MTQVHRPALYEAFKAYTRRAVAELGEACPERPSQVIVGLREWERVSENAFALRDRNEPYWMWCILQSAALRHAWPEYEAVEAAIRADPLLSTQIDTLVGTAMSARRQEVEHIADALIWALARKHGGFTFHETDFDEEFVRLIEAQQAEEVEVVILGPLVGLSGDGFPLRLERALEIREFDDSEIVSCLQMGLLRPPVGMQTYLHIDRVVGLRMRTVVPKVVGGRLDDATETMSPLQAEAIRNAESALGALRTFKRGRVTLTGLIQVISQSSGWSAIGGPAPGAAGVWWGDYELDKSEAEAFREYWDCLQAGRRRRLIDGAVRRFTYSADRHRADDRMVDLVIAAETLFLGDAGNPHERGELRYRFALRAAFFLETAGTDRRALFGFMRNSYDARSAIVHGGEPEPKLLRSLDGRQLTLPEYADAVEDVLRRAFRKAVEAPAKVATGPLVDWTSSSWDWGRITPRTTRCRLADRLLSPSTSSVTDPRQCTVWPAIICQ